MEILKNKRIESLEKKYQLKLVESDKRYNFLRLDENNIYEISFPKSSDDLKDSLTIDKVLNKVNEALGNGFSDAGVYGSSNGEPYFEYKIIPLNNSLEQKTNKKAEHFYRQLNNRIIHVGDFVSGVSISSGKNCKGTINKIHKDENGDIDKVYILAMGTGLIVALNPDSVSLSSPYPVRKKAIRQLNTQNIVASGGTFIGGRSY